jgi:predicted choloylglycine hydrolase
VQQGSANRELLHQTIEQVPNFVEVKRMKPRLAPMSLFLFLARRQATKTLEHDIVHYYPQQAERLKGIAEGAEVDVSWAFFAQSMELTVDFGASLVHVPACTSLGFTPQRTTSKETIIGKNWDYPNHFAPLLLTCHTQPEGCYQTLGCTMAPLPGMLDGMNEYGVTVTHNTAFPTDKPTCFAPNSLMLQEMLETCQNTEEAVHFLMKAKHASGALLMVGDAKGDIRTVEMSCTHAAIREPLNDQSMNTNHYHLREMQTIEISHNAVFSEKASKEWVGKRLHESSEERLKRAQELLTTKNIDEATITSILRDHGVDNHPSNLTLCQHGEYNSTLRSMILYPHRRTMKVAYGNPCQNTYTEFAFS